MLILAACCLHNFLRTGYLATKEQQNDHDSGEHPWNGFVPLRAAGGFAKSERFEVREAFTQYLNNQGALSWQERRINNRLL